MHGNLNPLGIGKMALLFGKVANDTLIKVNVLPGQRGGITEPKPCEGPQKHQGFPVGITNGHERLELPRGERFADILHARGQFDRRGWVVGDGVEGLGPVEEGPEHLDFDPLIGRGLPFRNQVAHELFDMVGLNVGDRVLKGGNPDTFDKLADHLAVANEGGVRLGVAFAFQPPFDHFLKLGQLGGRRGVSDNAQDLLGKLMGLGLLGKIL